MYEYGRLIGLAFQIQDDYLDLASDEQTLGKPIGSDIAKGKMTIIAIKALASCEGEDNKKLLEILKDDNNSSEDIDLSLNLFNKYGAIEYAKNVAAQNVVDAKKVLEILPESESKQMLFDLADFVLERHS